MPAKILTPDRGGIPGSIPSIPPPPPQENAMADSLSRAGVPLFDKHGTAYSPKTRAKKAKRKGLCGSCGIQTHEVRLIGSNLALTNDHVYRGTCIRCDVHDGKRVPMARYFKWKDKYMSRPSLPPHRDSAPPAQQRTSDASYSSINVTVEVEEEEQRQDEQTSMTADVVDRKIKKASSLQLPAKPTTPLVKCTSTPAPKSVTPLVKSISTPSPSSSGGTSSTSPTTPMTADKQAILQKWKEECIDETTTPASISPPVSTTTLDATTAVKAIESPNGTNSITLKVFQASPLAYEDFKGKQIAIPFLDLETEETQMKEALENSRIDVSFEAATANSLATFLSKGNQFLHFSCHGHPRYLFIEDGYGGGQRLLVGENLQGWIKAGGQKLSFVFVSACHSRSAGEAFVEAGVTHVVCCEQDGQALSNTAALVFSRDFYRAVAHGKTIQQAYDLARMGVIHSAELARKEGMVPEEEANKFALLPEEGVDHEVALFASSASECQSFQNETTTPPKKKQRTSVVPFPPQSFLGREVDMYAIMKDLFVTKRARLVHITGDPGIGKASLAKALGHYMEKRNMWGSTVWLPSPMSGSDGPHAISLWSELFALIQDSEIPALSFKTNKSYHKARQDILNHFYEEKATIIINAKGFSKAAIFKISIFLDDLFEHTKNTKVIAVEESFNDPIQSQRPAGFECLETEHRLAPLGFAATAALFSRVCPHSTNPLRTEDDLYQKSGDKTLFKVLGNGYPALTMQIARRITEVEFQQLLEPERSVHSHEHRESLQLVELPPQATELQPPQLMQSSSRACSLVSDASGPSGDEDGPAKVDGGLLAEKPPITSRQASSSSQSERRSLIYLHDLGEQKPRSLLTEDSDSEDSEDESPPLRSQPEVFKRFAPILRREGKIHRKKVTAFIRKAINGEKVVTTIDGKQETQYEVKDDESWLVCGKAAGEYYVLTDVQLHTNYDTENAKEIKPDNPYPFAGRLRQQGFMEYRSRRKVWARPVTEFDMNFFRHGIEDKTNSGAYFMAPWGESMLVEQGDYLVMQYPEENKEIYRIEYHVFHDSYVDDEEQEKNTQISIPVEEATIAVAVGAVVILVGMALYRAFSRTKA